MLHFITNQNRRKKQLTQFVFTKCDGTDSEPTNKAKIRLNTTQLQLIRQVWAAWILDVCGIACYEHHNV